ncbi:MAG: hypothetical protein ACP5OB_01060 [Candidatus Ratteibacteria bacterium]
MGVRVPLPAQKTKETIENLKNEKNKVPRLKKDAKIKEKTPIWEDILIIISIFSLWPTILRKENLLTRLITFVFLCLLIWILMRRIKRIKNI